MRSVLVGERRRKCAYRFCNRDVVLVSDKGVRYLGRKPSYCSNTCRQAAYRDRRREQWRSAHTYGPGTSWSCTGCWGHFTNGERFVGAPKACPFCGGELVTQASLFDRNGAPWAKAMGRA